MNRRGPRAGLAGVGALALAVALAAPGAAAAGVGAAAAPPAVAPLQLLPGEYLWLPELAPRGPVLVLVSLPEQRAYVYRNGVRIGVSTVSTGKPGFETPTGLFTILQKKREHYSNLYDDAPMPFMQRLTWDGIALHAGRVPGHPASHGCVRLPYAFSERLFDVTSQGITVVITDEPGRAPMLAEPGLFRAPAPVPAVTTQSTPIAAHRLPTPAWAGYAWAPELAPPGALNVVVSGADRALVVLREGVEIGRAPLQPGEPLPGGTRAFQLLDGPGPGATPGAPRRRWVQVLGEPVVDPARLARAIGVAPAFATLVGEALAPGATVVITDQPLRTAPLTVLDAEGGGAPAVQPASAGGG
ncbi:MAG TPA: L,D-transpeptidase family protein [Arenimonas sp.]|uniref:L,D-transpeptidase family protein n=1 Tax=Arenimonas sp. TaxID=1872635 RepID=UPI002D7FFB31|nr:L,D-transpeptidase family protein [Arenimonas sp.]HEU0153518.1 L,D-transpeptidase family protein [Arenimonas sp.]